jgi:hypothetical protein
MHSTVFWRILQCCGHQGRSPGHHGDTGEVDTQDIAPTDAFAELSPSNNYCNEGHQGQVENSESVAAVQSPSHYSVPSLSSILAEKQSPAKTVTKEVVRRFIAQHVQATSSQPEGL